jgi:predicted GH43/DUF377 family glycosyl hydrolase
MTCEYTIHQLKLNNKIELQLDEWYNAVKNHEGLKYKLWEINEIYSRLDLPNWIHDCINKSQDKEKTTSVIIGLFILYEFGGCYIPHNLTQNVKIELHHFKVPYHIDDTQGIIYSFKKSANVAYLIQNIESNYINNELSLHPEYFDRKHMLSKIYTNNPNEHNKNHTFSKKFTSLTSKFQALDGIRIDSDRLLQKSSFSIGNVQPCLYFNGSICKYKDKTLFAYRMECLKSTKNIKWFDWISIGLTELSQDLKNEFEPSLRFRCQIKLSAQSKKLPDALQGQERINVLNGDHWEDPRLFTLNNGKELWICFTNGYEIGFAQLFVDFKKNTVEPRVQFMCESIGEKTMDKDRREKNWTPFDKNGELWVHYQYSPQHIIYQLDKKTGNVIKTIKHETPDSLIQKEKTWMGSIRGGTPAISLNDKYNITFFHTRTNYCTPYYAYYTAGTLLFEKNSGKIVYCSDTIIKPSSFINIVPRPGQLSVVFPAGIIKNGENIIVSYGLNDYDTFVLKLKLKDVIPEEFL